MYKLLLHYYQEKLKAILTHEESFEYIGQLSNWIEHNVLQFNYTKNQPVTYTIVKTEDK